MCAGSELLQDMETLNSEQRKVAWGLGATERSQLSKLATTPALIRLYQLLLFTMPGTPVFTYGDEIGLQAGQVGSTTDLMHRKQKCWPHNSSSVNILSTFSLPTRVQILQRWFGTHRKPHRKKPLEMQQLRYVCQPWRRVWVHQRITKNNIFLLRFVALTQSLALPT